MVDYLLYKYSRRLIIYLYITLYLYLYLLANVYIYILREDGKLAELSNPLHFLF